LAIYYSVFWHSGMEGSHEHGSQSFSNVTILLSDSDSDCTSDFRPRPGSGPWLLPSPASASSRNSNSEPISISTTQWHMSEWWTSAYLLVPSSIIRWIAVRGTGNWHKRKVQCASYVATNTSYSRAIVDIRLWHWCAIYCHCIRRQKRGVAWQIRWEKMTACPAALRLVDIPKRAM